MPFKTSWYKTGIIFVFILLTSCVKDIDINQYEEIVIPPQAALDLIYFNLNGEDFSSGSNSNMRAYDVTRLDFLDDDYIQNNLVRADFNFRFFNSFPREFVAVIRLLSEGNAVQHELLVPIPAGSTANPTTIDYTDIINEDQIRKVRRSIKISVEITTHNAPFVDGELRLESRGYYYFEF